MLRIVTMLVLAVLLDGCNVVFIPIPIGGLTLPAVPAATPTAEPTEPAADVPADVALFNERYAAFESTFNALSTHMESMAFDDAAWRDETARLALEWHDAVDVLRVTTCPDGDQWDKACDLIDSAMARFGFAAGDTEKAARENNQGYLANVRSDLIQGTTLLGDAMRLLGEE